MRALATCVCIRFRCVRLLSGVLSSPLRVLHCLPSNHSSVIRLLCQLLVRSQFKIIWSPRIAGYGSTGQGCQSRSGSAQQGKTLYPCPRSRLRFWSCETGSALPSRVTLLTPHTKAEPCAYSPWDSCLFPRWWCLFIYYANRQNMLSSQSRVYRVPYCVPMSFTAESPPAEDQVVTVTGAAFTSLFIFFSFISLIADGPHHYHPACGHKGSSYLSLVHALQFFLSRCKFSTLTTRQPMVELYLLTFPRFP